MGFFRAASDAAAQLVELREAEALGVFDDHQSGVGNVHADFDHGGGDEDLDFVAAELFHHGVFFVVFQAPVQQTDAKFGKTCFARRSYSAVAAFSSCFDSSMTG